MQNSLVFHCRTAVIVLSHDFNRTISYNIIVSALFYKTFCSLVDFCSLFKHEKGIKKNQNCCNDVEPSLKLWYLYTSCFQFIIKLTSCHVHALELLKRYRTFIFAAACSMWYVHQRNLNSIFPLKKYTDHFFSINFGKKNSTKLKMISHASLLIRVILRLNSFGLKIEIHSFLIICSSNSCHLHTVTST